MIRKDILGKNIKNNTFLINTITKEIGYLVENNKLRCIYLLDNVDYYRMYDKIVENFSEWCSIRADQVTVKQYECLKYNVFVDKKDDFKRKKYDDVLNQLDKKYHKLSSATVIKKVLDYISNHKNFLISLEEISKFLNTSPYKTLIVLGYLIDDKLINRIYNKKLEIRSKNSFYYISKNKEKVLDYLNKV